MYNESMRFGSFKDFLIESHEDCQITKGAKREWVIQGRYAHGWEDVATYETRKEALPELKNYQENEIGTPFRIKSQPVKN